MDVDRKIIEFIRKWLFNVQNQIINCRFVDFQAIEDVGNIPGLGHCAIKVCG